MRKFAKGIVIFLMIGTLLLCGGCKGGPGESETGAGQSGDDRAGNGMGTGGTTEISLYEHGLEVVARMAEMAGSREYVGLYTSSPELAGILSSVGEGDFSEPSAVYRIRATKGVASVLELAELDTLPDELRANVEEKMFLTLATQINGMEGTAALAAASLCTAEKLFVSGELTENEIYLYVYENATPAAVTFVMGENGAVAARGMFILYEEFLAEGMEMEEAAGVWEEFGVWVERLEER